MLASAESLWVTVVACGASFVCGMWLKNRIMNWISRG